MIDALPLLLGDDGYQISRSVRLRSSASAYFNRTPASNGNRQTSTLSFWFKRGALGTSQMVFDCGEVVTPVVTRVSFLSGDTLRIENLNSTRNIDLVTSQVFRDPSAWYHIVVAFDTTQATSSNRVKLYVNGVQITAFSTNSITIAQNGNLAFNSTSYAFNIGRNVNNAEYTDGYLTEVNFIDGQALTPSSFGEFDAITGVWKPKKYTGTYGTNGFYLNFSDNSAATAAAIGKDYSGNGNNWTPNNISVTSGVTYDSMLDVPTPWADGGNGRGNYATLNPLLNSGYSTTYSEGNLQLSGTFGVGQASIFVDGGKWYVEMVYSAIGGTPTMVGPTGSVASVSYQNDGNKRINSTTTSYGATYATNDVIGCAFDVDAGTTEFFKNGVSQGVISQALGTSVVFRTTSNAASGTNTLRVNFGQRPFAYTPPTGFRALNTQNLPVPTILKGNQYFNTVLYTGNGGTLSVTGVGFQPDFVWLKSRGAARSHRLWDAVRGATNGLSSDLTNAEYVESGLTAFNSDGFTLGSQSGSNTNAEAFVAWNWKEGATQGFDIVTYTGTGSNTTVAHNLGVAPRMIIYKRRSAIDSWIVYHASIGAANNLVLNSTVAQQANGNVYWNSTAPTSSVFSVGTDSAVNANTSTYVAYLFAEVAGFSRFGSYTGNGSADGPFVFCGFRPRWLMFKRTDSTGWWYVWDSVRQTFNLMGPALFPNDASAESVYTGGASLGLDLLSNGFKLRGSQTEQNASGGTYIFAAFAENPQKFALAR